MAWRRRLLTFGHRWLARGLILAMIASLTLTLAPARVANPATAELATPADVGAGVALATPAGSSDQPPESSTDRLASRASPVFGEPTLPVDAEVDAALRRGLIESPDIWPDLRFFAIADVRTVGDWRFVSVVGLAEPPDGSRWRLVEANAFFLALLRRDAVGDYVVAFEDTPRFSELLAGAPDAVIAAEHKAGLASQSRAPTIVLDRLPFEAGGRVRYGTLGVHTGGIGSVPGGWAAVDFGSDDGTAIGHAANRLLAAQAGVVSAVCRDATQVAIRIGDLSYAHLVDNPNLMVGHAFASGEYIGSLITGTVATTCGTTNQGAASFHCHFSFPANATLQVEGWTLDPAEGVNAPFRKNGVEIAPGGWLPVGGGAARTVYVINAETIDQNTNPKTNFQPGETLGLRLRAENGLGSSGPSTWSFDVYDPTGAKVTALSNDNFPAALNAGTYTYFFTFTIPNNQPAGVYTFIGTVAFAGGSDQRSTTFGINVTTPALGHPRLIQPTRVVDTRPTLQAINVFTVGFDDNGAPIAPGRLAAGAVKRYKIAGQTFGGVAIPADATGVLINVTISQDANAGLGGYLVVYPGDASQPLAATVNPSASLSYNFTVVGLGAGGPAPTRQPSAGRQPGVALGTIAVANIGIARDVIIDLVGYYSPTNPPIGNLNFIPPTRVLDTRPGTTVGFTPGGAPITPAPITPNAINRYGLANRTFSGVTFPANVGGVIAHITTVQGAGAGGYTTLLPGDASLPVGTSSLNPVHPISFNSWVTGIPVAGPTNTPGAFGVFSTNSQDVIVDVVGYFAPNNPNTAGALTFVPPARVLDTRGAPSGPIGFQPNGSPITAGLLPDQSLTRYRLSGQTFANGALTLPANVKGALMNVTLVQTGASGGYVTVFPGDAGAPPTAATVNPNAPIAGSFWASGVPTGGSFPGALGVYSVGVARDVIIDLVGYFQ